MKRTIQILLSKVMICSVLIGQTPISQDSVQPSSRLKFIKASRFLDVVTGAYVSPALVLVEGERIKAIGPSMEIPMGSEVIDLGDATLLPGLIDTHTHLLTRLDTAKEIDPEKGIRILQTETSRRVLLGAAMAREMMDAGYTSVRDLGNSGRNGDVALRDAIEEGLIPGPRMQVSTRALSPIGGQFRHLPAISQPLVDEEYAVITGVEEARKAVRQAIYDGADLIKVIVNKGSLVLSSDEMKVIVEEAHRAKRKVAAHATHGPALRIATGAGVDSIEHGYIVPDDVWKEMAQKKIYLVPTDATLEGYKAFLVTPRHLPLDEEMTIVRELSTFNQGNTARLTIARKLGVPIAAGSDRYFRSERQTRGQASLDVLLSYVEAGMTPLEAIRTTTICAADLMGWAQKVGSLAPGKFADIIAVKGDPMKDITTLARISFVMKGGSIVRNSKQTK